jgi:endonuclease YncB( thermonuclease family)
MKKTVTALLCSCVLFGLVGCNVSQTSSSNTGSTGTSSSVSESGSSSSSTTHIDYVASTHLALDYSGHDFLTEGIGEVSLKENVDGDTTHFYPVNSSGSIDKSVTIKSRYLCVDTPESTGQIQPWGKAASKFTASKINAAKTIVVSSNFTDYSSGAKADSTGTRYLSYVWVSEKENCPYNELELVNLMLVQNGYSATKAATDSIYSDTFYKTDAQAQSEKLVIWSGKDDPDYIYATGTTTTIQDIVLGRFYDDETGDYVTYDWTDSAHNKVAFDCYVAMNHGDNAYVYADLPDPEDSTKTVRYGLYVFTGYRGIAPLTHIGWKLNIVGNCTSFNGNLQITNVSYNQLYHQDDDITVLEKVTGGVYSAPVITPTEASKDQWMNVVVKVNGLHGVKGYGTYADSDNSAFTVKCLNASDEVIYVRFEKGTITDRNNVGTVIADTNFEDYFCTDGETFNVYAPISRYTNSKGVTTYQLYVCHNADLVFNA